MQESKKKCPASGFPAASGPGLPGHTASRPVASAGHASPRRFTRFTRKGYAIFAGLHHEVLIGVLSVATLASVNIPKVRAMQVSNHPDSSDDSDDTTELAEVAVAGTMSPLTALQSARIVSVITAQQIESSAAQSVNDLLKLAAGVDVRQRGGFGIQTDISIDGGTFDQITLLLNGVNISSPHTGHLAADFPITLSDIDHIEVLEGAASRVYGASAFGGAINIVTKTTPPSTHKNSISPISPNSPISPTSPSDAPRRSPTLSLDAGAHGGSYATFGADARLAFHQSPPTAKAAASLSAHYQRSDGATANSDFRRGGVFLRAVYDARDFRIDGQAGYSQKSYGANTFYSAAYPDQYERNTRLITSLGAETKGRLRVRPEVYWHRLFDHFQLIRNTTTGENFHVSDVHGARVSASLRWAAGHTSLGAEVREEEIASTTLGRLTSAASTPTPSASATADPSTSSHASAATRSSTSGGFPAESPSFWRGTYPRHDRRTNLSLNAEHNLLLPHLTVSVGVLANYNTRFDSHLRLYPGIDLAVTPAPAWRLFASYNKGFRLPTFTDLYYKSPTHEGNQDMKAEESHSFQLGATWRTTAAEATLKGFYHRGTDLIDWVMYSATDVFHSAAFDLDNVGLSAQTTLHLTRLCPGGCAGLQRLMLAYTYMHQHRRDDVAIYKSNYAMEYLRHKLVATLDHHIWGPITASWTLRWQDRMGNYILYEDGQTTGQLVSYHPYATLDVKLRCQLRHTELWAEATNLTHHRYYDLGNVPQPGLTALGGIRVRF